MFLAYINIKSSKELFNKKECYLWRVDVPLQLEPYLVVPMTDI